MSGGGKNIDIYHTIPYHTRQTKGCPHYNHRNLFCIIIYTIPYHTIPYHRLTEPATAKCSRGPGRVARSRLLAAHGARSYLSVRTQPPMATYYTKAIPYHTGAHRPLPYHTMVCYRRRNQQLRLVLALLCLPLIWLARGVYLLVGAVEVWGGWRGHANPCAVLCYVVLCYGVGVGGTRISGRRFNTIPYVNTYHAPYHTRVVAMQSPAVAVQTTNQPGN